jgi:hypothetical protein
MSDARKIICITPEIKCDMSLCDNTMTRVRSGVEGGCYKPVWSSNDMLARRDRHTTRECEYLSVSGVEGGRRRKAVHSTSKLY